MCEEPWHSVVDKKDYNKFCTCIENCHLCALKLTVKKENEKEVLRHSILEENG